MRYQSEVQLEQKLIKVRLLFSDQTCLLIVFRAKKQHATLCIIAVNLVDKPDKSLDSILDLPNRIMESVYFYLQDFGNW